MDRLVLGDQVVVISGKDKGKKGRITKVIKDRNLVVVEGINLVTKHEKPNQRNQEGGRFQREAPIDASKVMPIDPTTGKGTRVKVKVGEDGKKSRVAKSGAVITAS